MLEPPEDHNNKNTPIKDLADNLSSKKPELTQKSDLCFPIDG